MIALQNVPTVYLDSARAEKVAAALQEGDGDWTYRVEPTGGGTYRISIRDEAGDFVGYFGT